MAIETRRNGQTYFYRKRRQGARVVSEYVGAGPTADLIAHLDELERQERAAALKAKRAQRAEAAHQDAQLEHAAARAALVERAALILGDCYFHHGEWRRKRAKKE